MFNKTIVLNIFCSKKPYQLIVLSDNGCELLKTIIKSNNSKICFCRDTCKIKLIAKYKNQISFKSLCIDKDCKNFFVNFAFNLAFVPKVNNDIILTDTNYGLPVIKALLVFKANNIN